MDIWGDALSWESKYKMVLQHICEMPADNFHFRFNADKKNYYDSDILIPNERASRDNVYGMKIPEKYLTESNCKSFVEYIADCAGVSVKKLIRIAARFVVYL